METDFSIRSRRAVLCLVLLLASLAFLFLPAPQNGINSFEPRLSYGDSWNIAAKTISENPKNFFLGSGPSTFAYQFSLYKDKGLNQAGMGSLIFDQGAIPFFTLLTTTGVAGMISLFSIIFVFYFQGFRYFMGFKRKDNDFSINVNDILFAMAFSSSLLIFFYRIDVASLVFIFLPLGLWVGQQQADEKIIRIEKYSKNLLEALFVIVFMGLLLIIFNFVNYYRSEVLYEKAISNYKSGGDVASSISEMEKASQIWRASDNYIILSQLYLIKASDDFSLSSGSSEEKSAIKDLVVKSEGTASFATEIDSNNFQSWQNLGLIYENANFVLEDQTAEAFNAYAKAEKLAPQNEDIYLAEGRMLESEGKAKDALDKYEKAFTLNPLNSQTEEKIKELK